MKINWNKCEKYTKSKSISDKTVLSAFFVVEIVTIEYLKIKYL